jgi:hypothetical protein
VENRDACVGEVRCSLTEYIQIRISTRTNEGSEWEQVQVTVLRAHKKEHGVLNCIGKLTCRF